jgi:hypothetical protein
MNGDMRGVGRGLSYVTIPAFVLRACVIVKITRQNAWPGFELIRPYPTSMRDQF